MGSYDSAVSRAYYAMFRAAIALLEHYGDVRPGWNHGRLEQTLRREMVRDRGPVHDGDVREFRSVYALRIIADYRDRHLSSQEAQTVWSGHPLCSQNRGSYPWCNSPLKKRSGR